MNVDPSGFISYSRFWWGYRVYLTNAEANGLVQYSTYYRTVVVGLLGKFVPGGGWLIGIAVNVLMQIKSDTIKKKNTKNGVYLDFSWWHIGQFPFAPWLVCLTVGVGAR